MLRVMLRSSANTPTSGSLRSFPSGKASPHKGAGGSGGQCQENHQQSLNPPPPRTQTTTMWRHCTCRSDSRAWDRSGDSRKPKLKRWKLPQALAGFLKPPRHWRWALKMRLGHPSLSAAAGTSSTHAAQIRCMHGASDDHK